MNKKFSGKEPKKMFDLRGFMNLHPYRFYDVLVGKMPDRERLGLMESYVASAEAGERNWTIDVFLESEVWEMMETEMILRRDYPLFYAKWYPKRLLTPKGPVSDERVKEVVRELKRKKY